MIESSEIEKNSRGPMFEFSSKEFSSSNMTDQGDSSSTEESESPRSVVTAARKGMGEKGRWRRWRKVNSTDANDSDLKESNKGYLHSQVLRIKEEELQIGEEINLVGDYHDNYVENSLPLDDQFVIWSRSILPASPLSGKRNSNNRNG